MAVTGLLPSRFFPAPVALFLGIPARRTFDSPPPPHLTVLCRALPADFLLYHHHH
ncbi:hypothetical protein B9Z19DRAFT_474913 [Tuber borchii]|uniref:Uncharacterized protein n=1 Tax=Tuber borchii TaxID=42251 RepID=A0A2T7A389_TUBBO|nr:hypothetical protein B9Z19DRAFT_474913 [Tuber borchii]